MKSWFHSQVAALVAPVNKVIRALQIKEYTGFESITYKGHIALYK